MKTTAIYRFNVKGLKEFSAFLKKAREDESTGAAKPPLPDFVSDPSLVEIVSKSTALECSKIFANRYELASHLKKRWLDFRQEQYEDIGLWAWLAALFFDQLRAKRGPTQRPEHFILDSYDPATLSKNLDYRHAVREPFFLLNNYEDNFCKFILTGRSVSEAGDPWENCCGNKSIMSSKTMRSLMCELYQDPTSMSVKSGAFTKPNKSSRKSTAGKGGAQRLIPVIIPRLKKSFDIEAMAVTNIITELGPEVSNSKWVK